jgi:hypothetical protein
MIKNTDLETLYNKIGGRIDLIGSHVGDPEILPKIMRSCRLKPYSIFSGNLQSKAIYEPLWVDEFGNSIRLDDKKLKIIMNDTQISKYTKISTDLFLGNSIDIIAKNSKCMLIINGENNGSCYFVSFYGKDDYLRCFFFYKELARVSPLLLGINTLQAYFRNIHSVLKTNIDKNKLDLLVKFNVVDCVICWEPAGWKDHIKGDCK